jgi:ribosomal protein L37E
MSFPEPGPERLLVELLAELMYEHNTHFAYGNDGKRWIALDVAVKGWWRDRALRMIGRGYRLHGLAETPEAIQCLRCGLTSYNENDIAQRYCGRCKVFHREEGGL